VAEEDKIFVTSLVGYKTGEPLIEIELKGQKAQMGVKQAREHALAVLECAEAAETDLFVFRWLTETIGAPPSQAAQVLADFRQRRKQ